VGLGWALELRNGPRSRVPQREHESSGEESALTCLRTLSEISSDGMYIWALEFMCAVAIDYKGILSDRSAEIRARIAHAAHDKLLHSSAYRGSRWAYRGSSVATRTSQAASKAVKQAIASSFRLSSLLVNVRLRLRDWVTVKSLTVKNCEARSIVQVRGARVSNHLQISKPHSF